MSHLRCRPPVHAWLRAAALTCALALIVTPLSCLDRPVAPTQPDTTNVVVEVVRQDRVERIDLLFMIDNSISMADKQAMLASAVPQLMRRLVQPRCVDALGNPTGEPYPCANGAPEFRPVLDIHVGVLSSSLGAHGGGPQFCPDTPPTNDRARLMPAVRPELALPQDGNGFLWWRPSDPSFSEDDVLAFSTRFEKHVRAPGEQGCGYEASLESWYRFLIDPSPPATVQREGSQTVASGIDETLLAQRAEFLRPDSLVAIVMLSDENDCSIRDSDAGWYATFDAELAPGTSACANDPNDPCCRSCASVESNGPPAGCTPLCDDAACAPNCKTALAPELDRRGLRCWDQKRRFGIDFMYPTARYVRALTSEKICPLRHDLSPEGCSPEELVENPLFRPGPGMLRPRSKELVFLAGIVGVPWQDLATPETLGAPGQLDYMSVDELAAAGRFAWITPSAGAPPADPLMRESNVPRSGEHPSGDPALAIAGPDAAPGANAANGHEWRPEELAEPNPKHLGDLQYACIYPLPETSCAGNPSCDCAAVGKPGYTQNKPLCQASDGSYTETQRFAKAYPGTRQLEVLRDFGNNGIVASICPKVIDSQSADYGYDPAVDAIVDRLAIALSGRCMPRKLTIEDGKVACLLAEASPGDASCQCDAALGRQPLPPELAAPIRHQLATQGACGTGDGQVACESLCLCEIAPYSGADLEKCQTDSTFQADAGWCYVDPSQDHPPANPGTDAMVARCALHERRLLRVEPQSGSSVVIACQGAAL